MSRSLRITLNRAPQPDNPTASRSGQEKPKE
ncbi:hypothetical protein RHECNPAF_4460061 [Rhizobium etli CNPAF512]|nr:hypothetical protein RHECNPAF_4460061 [Rhizobium etli CNPAF512]